MTLNDWQRVAREMRAVVIHSVDDGNGYSDCMEQVADDDDLGEAYISAETAAKEILRLRKRVEVLAAVVNAAESCCHAHEQVPKVAPLLHFAIRSLRTALDAAKEAADG